MVQLRPESFFEIEMISVLAGRGCSPLKFAAPVGTCSKHVSQDFVPVCPRPLPSGLCKKFAERTIPSRRKRSITVSLVYRCQRGDTKLPRVSSQNLLPLRVPTLECAGNFPFFKVNCKAPPLFLQCGVSSHACTTCASPRGPPRRQVGVPVDAGLPPHVSRVASTICRLRTCLSREKNKVCAAVLVGLDVQD